MGVRGWKREYREVAEEANDLQAGGAKEQRPKSFGEWLKLRSADLKWGAPHHVLLTEKLEGLARLLIPGSKAEVQVEGAAEGDRAVPAGEETGRNCRLESVDCRSQIGTEAGGVEEVRASPPAPLLRGEGSLQNRRLMVFMPPRHGKSELATIRFAAYLLERDPSLRIIVGAHTQVLAAKFSRGIRRLVRGIGKLSSERRAQTEWETSAGGGLRAVGVGTGIVGFGADAIVIDDPVKSREEADSATYRERVWEWYTDDLLTRQQPGCAIILIQTRWHEDDLAGRILRSPNGHKWDVVRLPAFAETQEERDAWAERNKRPTGEPDPIGREPGVEIWPEEWPAERLEEQRADLGGNSFLALYQQTPVDATGGLFKRESFTLVDEVPPGLRWIRYWDTAAKASERNDYTAGAWCAITRNKDLYIRDMVRGRWEYPEMRATILQTAKMDGERTMIGVEDTGSGTVILQDLKRDGALDGYILKGTRVSADKVVRAGPWAALASVGKVYLVKGEWNHAFLDEAVTFPAGGHDDQIDAVSGAYQLMMENPAFGPNPIRLPMMGPGYVPGLAPRCLVPGMG